MLEYFKFEKRYWYPHMKPLDIAIWERFIDQNPGMYETCQYDVEVGDIPPFITESPEEEVRKQGNLYQLKIDVIGYRQSGSDIIELKPAAGPATIGQVQSYKALYERDYAPSVKPGLVIVTDSERANMRFLCEQAGVKLILVT